MRTVYSGLVDESFIGQTVTLYGWAHRRRDHGGVIFAKGLFRSFAIRTAPRSFLRPTTAAMSTVSR